MFCVGHRVCTCIAVDRRAKKPQEVGLPLGNVCQTCKICLVLVLWAADNAPKPHPLPRKVLSSTSSSVPYPYECPLLRTLPISHSFRLSNLRICIFACIACPMQVAGGGRSTPSFGPVPGAGFKLLKPIQCGVHAVGFRRRGC